MPSLGLAQGHEVISPSTEAEGRGPKRLAYQTIPTLADDC